MKTSPVTPAFELILAARRRALSTQLEAVFPAPKNFVWEVGSGHGHFLTAYAEAHPDTVCVGIDLVAERVERALRKRNRARLSNLHFLQAEARLFLEVLPHQARIQKAFVLFPDPWPKLRHRKHRIMQPEFLAAVARHSTSDTQLHFRTDFRPYFDAVRAGVASDPHWEAAEEAWPFEFETVFQSRAPAHHSLTLRRRA